MSLGPRLDLRQSQSLVMTPQLRQAIKLLQSSNLEVSAFVEEELERNPLLEWDERATPGPDAGRSTDPLPASAEPTDSHAASMSDAMPTEAAAPLDADWSNVHDSDGGYESPYGRGGGTSFDDDLSGLENMAGQAPNLREHIAEQIRLTFTEARDRLIAANLLALVDAAGRSRGRSRAMCAASSVS